MRMAARVYVPATRESLAGFVAAGSIPASAERHLVAAGAYGDEAAEYAALMSAADDSALLPGRRRVVVVAELAEGADVDGPVPMERVVAIHADTEDDADPETDLAWFAVQEIPDLLG